MPPLGAHYNSVRSDADDVIALERETIDRLRTPAKTDPSLSITKKLASSLGKLGFHLRALDRPQEALDFDKEAVELRRELMGKYAGREGRDIQHLSSSLQSLAWDHYALHQSRRASAKGKLAEMDPGATKDLASSLNNLGIYLRALARPQEALGFDQEAVQLLRELVERDPTRTADLCSSLHSLAWDHHAVQKHEEAVPLEREAVDLLRTLVGTDPSVIKNLASSLKNLCCYLRALARPQEALRFEAEAAELRRELGTHSTFTSEGPSTPVELENVLIVKIKKGHVESAAVPIPSQCSLAPKRSGAEIRKKPQWFIRIQLCTVITELYRWRALGIVESSMELGSWKGRRWTSNACTFFRCIVVIVPSYTADNQLSCSVWDASVTGTVIGGSLSLSCSNFDRRFLPFVTECFE
ncbi:hypothetical protein B0H10DRAFT_1949689 [Mycena sp. CBHHK59/15]|nr:hypothetical protein B0H10DRAFT_1949689 [Mycena sp. CBHHK59/15]